MQSTSYAMMTDEPVGHLLVIGIAIGMLAFAALGSLLIVALRDCRESMIEIVSSTLPSNDELTREEKGTASPRPAGIDVFNEKPAMLEKKG